MGHNLNLTEMYGLPQEVECPVCHRHTSADHEEYDIDCGDPIVNNNGSVTITTSHNCDNCEHDFTTMFTVVTTLTQTLRD